MVTYAEADPDGELMKTMELTHMMNLLDMEKATAAMSMMIMLMMMMKALKC